MSQIDVDALEDAEHPEGGYAIIVLKTADPLPDAPLFRLRPTDPAARTPAHDAIHASHAVRSGHDTTTVVIGPDLVESPVYVPGTQFEIAVIEPDLMGGFIWPSVTPQFRPKRKNLLAKRAARDSETDYSARSTPTAAAIVVSAPTGSQASTQSQQNPPPSAPAAAAAPVSTAAPISIDQNEPGDEHLVSAARTAALSIGYDAPAPRADDRAATISTADLKASSPAGSPARAPVMVSARVSASSIGALDMDRDIDNDRDRDQAADQTPKQTFYTSARSGGAVAAARAKQTGRGSFSLASPGVVAALTAAGVIGAQMLLFPNGFGSGPAPTPPPSLSASTATGSGLPPGTTFEALAAGPASPRGTAARDVPSQRALELAQAQAQVPAATRDADEGIYWFKRALHTAPGSMQTMRTMTQLGSLYAEGSASRAPDFAKARSVWEAAAAFGDAGAAFFLGQLSEHGLGSPVEPATALRWYERARASGTFPGVDDAITRMRRASGG